MFNFIGSVIAARVGRKSKNNEIFRTASWDGLVWLCSGVFVLLVAWWVTPWLVETYQGWQDILMRALVFSNTWGVVLLLYLFFSPYRYLLTPTEIVLKRRIGVITTIPYEQIVSVELREESLFRRLARTIVVNPGVFGYYGPFNDKKTGTEVSVYATRFKQMVELRTIRRTFYITPAKPEEFVVEVRRMMRHVGDQERQSSER